MRTIGHDVTSISELSPGLSDTEVLRLAYREARILITSDTDFGELVYQQNQKSAGIILLRLDDETNANKIRVLDSLLNSYSNKLKQHFAVVTETKVRIKSLISKMN